MAEPDVRPPAHNTILIKTTHIQHTSMPRRGSNDSEKKHVTYGLVSDYSVRRTSVGGQYVNQSSSCGLEKFGEDILTSPEVIRAQTLHLSQILNFHD